MTPDIRNYYWRGDDGRIFSSAAGMIVSEADAGYLSFVDAFGGPCPWPRDEAGEPSDAALEEVLAQHGLSLYPPSPAPAKVEELTAACAASIVGGFSSEALGSPHRYPSAITDQINLMGSVTDSLLPGLLPEWSTPFWCQDLAGIWAMREHSAAQIQQAGRDGKTHVLARQQHLDQLNSAAAQAASPEALAAIVWSEPG
ncbi:hypothetical protein ABLE91_16795 [Aquabacter sp. CN5-332]|uniref:DUF4376 domain-containing protein n=1 Tax=Aquabacter sp. CN5-332 TaxID=3156608 RepID=UPI0032B35765